MSPALPHSLVTALPTVSVIKCTLAEAGERLGLLFAQHRELTGRVGTEERVHCPLMPAARPPAQRDDSLPKATPASELTFDPGWTKSLFRHIKIWGSPLRKYGVRKRLPGVSCVPSAHMILACIAGQCLLRLSRYKPQLSLLLEVQPRGSYCFLMPYFFICKMGIFTDKPLIIMVRTNDWFLKKLDPMGN